MTHRRSKSLDILAVDLLVSLIQKIIAQWVAISIDDLDSATERDAIGMQIEIFDLTLEPAGQCRIIGIHDRDESPS